ncbi:glycoside hydrolase family 140 protein [Novosphingobium flavum]|uniref:Glycoside hydrolase family 140 protein n=1 Tax=Novosphingobium flavum TaxID=1778672 RepID=A0A7X1FNR6_9SPHN|nr:glycoside hydrolase family 140 protein [Novosphingobium flavum]MBC2664204.1 glycoside hydrolase family 140 protein [Novosphingobium flavum]
MRAITALFAATLLGGALPAAAQTPPLSVAPGGHYLLAGGKPFFWMGDTGWLLLSRTSRAEAERYLVTRKRQGFNVVQVMVLHTERMANPATGTALENGDPGRPRVTPGSDPARAGEYDYWDHLDWVAQRAEELGIYLALVPCWGSIADEGKLNPRNAAAYGRFLGERYGRRPNIIWLNGGDTRSEQRSIVWDALGAAIKQADPRHLMTFHPIGRTDSAWQFHTAPWLDFNMFQSGHRSYAQEGPSAHGEDNWRYVADDWVRVPAKPVIDGEPSYENIPHGLHEPAPQPRWQAADARRYAWWAVMAGAFGHTYGENHVMQFFTPGADTANFEPVTPWTEALEAPGANQMQFLRRLIESRPMLERVPDQSLIVGNGVRYERVLASRGRTYAFAYAYTGRTFTMRLGAVSGGQVRAQWYSPRDGAAVPIGTFPNRGVRRFDPPGNPAPGNDWVLVLDGVRAK